MKRSQAKRLQKAALSPTSRNLRLQDIRSDQRLSKSLSCPCFKLSTAIKHNLSLRKSSSSLYIRGQILFQKGNVLGNDVDIHFLQLRSASTNSTEKSINAAKNISSVCACPSPCSCLPPPCNTPAKCLQYMTGYYYYPYGTWFCGPYHVSTGSCPCAGPVKPGGPCGPVLPCPGDPCAPICCKPLSCCGVCDIGGPFQPNNTSNAYNTWHFGSSNMYSSYNPYNPNHYVDYNSYNPYHSHPQYSYYNGYSAMPNFGPCYNVPIAPIPVTNPIMTESAQTNTENQALKSSICWPLSKANINQDTKVSPNTTTTNAAYIKNFTQKPLSFSPPSSYNSKPTVSRTNPYTKPRINARTLQPSNSIGICYFSTKCMKKYSNKNKKLPNNLSDDMRSNKYLGVNKMITEEMTKIGNHSFNYWSLFGDATTRKD